MLVEETDNREVPRLINGDYELEKDNKYCEWLQLSNGEFMPSSKIITVKELAAGVYDINYSHKHDELIFTRKKLSLDELLHLPDPIFDKIINDIEYFWNNEDKFKKYNFTYKRGILLYGKPGCGKSSISLLLSEMVIKKGGLVFFVNNGDDLYNMVKALPKIKMIQHNTPVLCVFEDLDGLLINKNDESMLLNLLDGVNQTNNVVYIGNTNYPENLKERVTNRPSRFDRRYEIKTPNEEVRRFYLEKKISDEDKENVDIDYLTKQTQDFSLAHLGELVKSICIFNKDVDESIDEIKSMNKYISSTQYDKKGGVGFGGTK